MKTILHITECLGSGVLNYIKNLCEWQVNDFHIIIAYSTRPETPDDFERLFSPDVLFIKVKGFTREIEPINDLRAFIHIKKIIKDTNPDFIHLHSTKAGVLGRWAINCNKYRVFYSPHAYSFLMMDCSNTKRQFYRLIEKISDRRRCITVTDTEGEYEESKKVTKNAICIPNGINPDEMNEIITESSKHLLKNSRITICNVGKVVPQKNPVLFNEIAKRMPEYDFLWIGSGPLENLLDSNNIRITGWMPRCEAVAHVMSSDIFLFPSKWESLSIALMEAMYMGKPCVVSKCDGNKDVIENGENGILCDDIEEYVLAIKTIAENKKMAYELGEHAKNDILEKHNVKLIEEQYRSMLLF